MYSNVPAISIIVPVYKTEKYIARCLESLVNQTFRDIEIICVNDGSPDNSPAICEDYAKKDDRIILLSQTNQGLSAARNTGLLRSRGKYIQFCDSDDYFDPTMCEKMYNAIVTSGADIAAAGAKVLYEDVAVFSGDNEYYRIKFTGLRMVCDDVFQKTDVSVWNKIFKKESIDRYSIRFPMGLNNEDACFFAKYMFISNSIFFLNEPLYNYVRRVNSIMYNSIYLKTHKAIDHVNILYDIKIFMGKYGLTDKCKTIFVWMVLSYTNYAIWNGTKEIYHETFCKGTELLEGIDFNECMTGTHNQDDVLRLYALKKSDSELYFSIIKPNEFLNKKDFAGGLFVPVLRSCFLFPWYIYKSFCVINKKQFPRRNMKLLLKAYLFFPYYVLKMYLTLMNRRQSIGMHDVDVSHVTAKKLTEGKLEYYDGIVSVVIPVYNGGDYLKELITILKKQKKIKQLEIITIDSGSTDGSVEFLKKEKVGLDEIPKSSFSHSKTRNMGAEKASGNILLFMTQDAMPSSEDWVFKMILPIVEYGAIAVTCVEKARENASLFTYLLNGEFRRYFGVDEGDRIAELPNNKRDNYSLRRNALLNDIACAVKKDVFSTFLYQGEYAEDLDLGVRLIRSGHKIALLSSIQIIHSHERPCSYYLRLSYIDAKTNKNIFPDLSGVNKSLKEMLLEPAFSAYYHLQMLFVCIRSLQNNLNASDFFTFIEYYWNNGFNTELLESDKLEFGLWYSDTMVDDFLQMVLRMYPDMSLKGNSYVDSLKYYFNVSLRDFVVSNLKLIDDELRKQVIDALYKKWLWMLGSDLALYFYDHPDKNNHLFMALENMSKGI